MNTRNNIGVILPAGGTGTRLGASTPKQFLPIGGVPIIVRSVITVLQIPRLDSVVIAAHPDNHELLVAMLLEHKCNDSRVHLVEGGAERQESVARALGHPTMRDVDIVAVHDAVRPFASIELWKRVIQAAQEFGVAIPGLPVTDTIKVVDEKGLVVSTAARSSLCRVQTPQCFQRAIIMHAYERGVQVGQTATDCSALCERIGIPIHVVEGDERNIKITTPIDMEIASLFLPRN